MDDYLKDCPDVLDTDQLCKLLNVCKDKVYDLLRAGEIKSLRIGTKYIIPKLYVNEFLFNSKAI